MEQSYQRFWKIKFSIYPKKIQYTYKVFFFALTLKKHVKLLPNVFQSVDIYVFYPLTSRFQTPNANDVKDVTFEMSKLYIESP